MPYSGGATDAIAIKQQQLTNFLQAQQALRSGTQSYRIGNRQLTYVDLDKIQEIINQLMLEITMFQNGGRRRSFRAVPRDM